MKPLLCIAAILVIAALPRAAYSDPWTADGSLSDNLSTAQVFAQFSIRLPPSVGLKSHTVSAAGHTVYEWQMAGEHSKAFALTCETWQVAVANPASVLSAYAGGAVNHNFDGVVETEPEAGQIGALDFTRMYFKGMQHGATAKIHGLLYACVFNGRAFVLEATDCEPENSRTLPLAEAAILTFASTADQPQWNPDATLLSSLDPETDEYGYLIRLPTGFQPAGDNENAEDKGAAWHGAPIAGPTVPELLMDVLTLPDYAEDNQANVASAMEHLASIIVKDAANFQVTPVQHGTIAGIPAEYETFTDSGYYAEDVPITFHGFIYALMDGHSLVLAGGEDCDPDAATFIPVIETSVRTMHRDSGQ